jgi:hypothetical protein
MSCMMHEVTEDPHSRLRGKSALSRSTSSASTANAVLSAKDHRTKIELKFDCNTQIVRMTKFSTDRRRPTCVITDFTRFL